MNENDHDLLIQIATKLDRAIQDIKELKDNVAARVSALENEKLDRTEYDSYIKDHDIAHRALISQGLDHEKRIRFVERLTYLFIGAMTLLEVILKLYFH